MSLDGFVAFGLGWFFVWIDFFGLDFFFVWGCLCFFLGFLFGLVRFIVFFLVLEIALVDVL